MQCRGTLCSPSCRARAEVHDELVVGIPVVIRECSLYGADEEFLSEEMPQDELEQLMLVVYATPSSRIPFNSVTHVHVSHSNKKVGKLKNSL